MADFDRELYTDLSELANQYCLTNEELIARVGEYALWQELQDELSFLCLDCKVHTGKIGNYYMVHDSLWESVVPEGDGMLCFNCLAKRTGRDITVADLTDAPVNWKWLPEELRNPTQEEGEVCLSCVKEQV